MYTAQHLYAHIYNPMCQLTEALSLLGITEDIGYSFHSIAFPQQFVLLPQSLTGRMS